jgi:RimJ/RimL family protein N-acetyltransferase
LPTKHLRRPNPPLADDSIRLEPLAQSHAADFVELIRDSDVKRFTLVPSGADGSFVRHWLGRYETGWLDASRAGFCIRDAADGAFLGFAAIVHVDVDALEGEIGYMVSPAARGRGTSVRAVTLLTRWAFDELGLERLELRIDVANVASERVAERAGYRRDGVLRSLHFKEGLRSDTAVWSRLRTDEVPSPDHGRDRRNSH